MTYIKPSEVDIQLKHVAVGIPDDMYIEYHGLLPDGRKYVICHPKEGWDYNQFVCIVDKQIVRINKVIRYRDGGTTIVETEIGTFRFPTLFQSQIKPTLGEVEIIKYERLS